MFRRRNKADAESADAPSEEGHAQLEEPHASFEHARGSDSFDERPADAPAPVTASATLPVDDAHWELPAERWQPDDDFLRYSEEAFRAVASGGTEAPSSYGSAGYASEGFGGDAASPFGPVSDPFGSMAANASTPDHQALQPSVSSPAPPMISMS